MWPGRIVVRCGRGVQLEEWTDVDDKEHMLEEVRKQREFLMANEWVKYTPRYAGKACLVMRNSSGNGIPESVCNTYYEGLNPPLVQYLSLAIANVTGYVVGQHDGSPVTWNDKTCTNAGQAIAVLEETERLLKEAISDADATSSR